MVFQSERPLYGKTERAFEANRIYGHLNLVKRFFCDKRSTGLFSLQIMCLLASFPVFGCSVFCFKSFSVFPKAFALRLREKKKKTV